MSMDEPVAAQSQAEAPKTSGLATASLVFACLFFIPFLAALLGVMFGAVALRRIRSSDGRLRGEGMAIAGVIVGGLLLALWCIASLSWRVYVSSEHLLPELQTARRRALATSSKSNMKQIGLGVLMYQSDYGDVMPPDLQTLFAEGYVKDPRVFTYPGDPDADASDIDGTGGYYYFPLSKSTEDGGDPYPLDAAILWEKRVANLNGRVNVLTADGWVQITHPDSLLQHIEADKDLYITEPVMPAEPTGGEGP